jgi:hypothetical protein
MARALKIVPLLVMLAVLGGSAQGDVSAMRSRLEKRFEILPVAGGVVLTPRFKTDVRSIEVTDTIAVDGNPATGAELRQRLGDDADNILQISYLDPAARRSLAEAPGKPAAAAEPQVERPDSDDSPRRRGQRRGNDVVRVGGSVQVRAGEHVAGDVVAIGGSADVDGRVEGDLVAIGGSARLGPEAEVDGDVTVIGGRLERDPNAVIRGGVHEIGWGGLPWGDWSARRSWRLNPMAGMFPIGRLIGTLARMGLLILLAGLVILVARTPVEQIADRASAEPVKSWAVGFLIEILFVPILVLTIVVLAISIIGIPLLLLVPFAIVASMIVFLVGFTGVAYAIGESLKGRVEQLRGRPYLATILGIIAILSPLLLARLMSVTGGVVGGVGFVVGALVAVGFIVEYLAWTTGLGAAVLSRFSPPAPPMVSPVSTTPMITT